MTVIFDLDDTLFPEMDYVRSAYRSLASRFDLHLYPKMMVASSPSAAFDLIGGEMGEILEIYRTHKPKLILPAASLYLLDHLKRKGVKMGLISDGRSVTQRNKIEALGLTRFLSADLVMISQEVGADKLSDVAAKKILGLRPAENKFVYVGDNPAKDFIIPNLLGWTTILVTGGGNGDNLYGCDYKEVAGGTGRKFVVRNLWEAVELIDLLNI